jgi:hypothetical protein
MSTTTAAADSTAASPALLSLRTFLKQYSLSKSQFYREAAKGNAPPIVKNGGAPSSRPPRQRPGSPRVSSRRRASAKRPGVRAKPTCNV